MGLPLSLFSPDEFVWQVVLISNLWKFVEGRFRNLSNFLNAVRRQLLASGSRRWINLEWNHYRICWSCRARTWVVLLSQSPFCFHLFHSLVCDLLFCFLHLFVFEFLVYFVYGCGSSTGVLVLPQLLYVVVGVVHSDQLLRHHEFLLCCCHIWLFKFFDSLVNLLIERRTCRLGVVAGVLFFKLLQ
jgi:hypothetical protein